jgi:hypothetical protein
VFWWRDDDAIERTPPLDRLLHLRRRFDVPLALSVIPALAQRSLRSAVEDERGVMVLQHGWDHRNHNNAGRESEFPSGRDPREVRRQLDAGWTRLHEMFGPLALPVLVPPYNRISGDLIPYAAEKFRYLSVHADLPAVGMPSRNTHLDIVDWHTTKAVRNERLIASLLVALRLRRFGVVPRTWPIGILSHHLAFTEPMWSSVSDVLAHLGSHPTAHFASFHLIFGSHDQKH